MDTPKAKQSIEGKHLFVAAGSIMGWFFMLAAVPAYAFYWRVSNEPGAGSGSGFLAAALVFFCGGGLVLLPSQLYLLIKKSWLILGLTWLVCLGLLIGAVYLSPILLLLMV